MKFRFLPVLFLIFTSFISYAVETDGEGYPVVYLRGDFGRDGWNPDPSYRFTRIGQNYSLEITGSNPIPENAKFKIGDSDWVFDFGAPNEGIYYDKTQTVQLSTKGPNCRTHGIYEGRISFEYTTGNTLEVDFVVTRTQEDLSQLITGTLPVMHINVYKDAEHSAFQNEIIDYKLSHKDYFTEADYWIEIPEDAAKSFDNLKEIGSEDSPLPLQIKARGNWTRIGFSKKPYKIKLDKKQDLLGITPEKSKHYALLAHADDNKGYLRNYVAFNLGERIGLPFVPGQFPIELVINGDYRGLYFLTESVRVGDGRIEIEELDDLETEPDLISGGYVVELDNYDEENQIRMDELSFVKNQFLDRLRITWDTPEDYSDIQKRFITDQFSAMNKAVGKCSDDLWQYIDMDDLARYYLVEEIVSHAESFHGSTYLFRDRGEGEKWHFSPLWDCGMAFSGRTDMYFYDCDPYGNTWIPSIAVNNSFVKKMKDTWLWFMSNEFEGIYDDIDEYCESISRAAVSDRARWKGKPVPDGGMEVADNSNMQKRKKEVTDHLQEKINWLKRQFGDFSARVFDEPDRDDTPAAPLPSYAQADIETIIDSFGADSDEGPIYYNLQGVRVYNPVKGEIYIMRSKGKTMKIRK